MKNVRPMVPPVFASLLFAACAGLGVPRGASAPDTSSAAIIVADRGAPIPGGSGALLVRLQLKTHAAGRLPLEPANSPHGAQRYPFEVSVDGRTARWEAEGIPEAAGDSRPGPENGEGVRYALERRLILPAGEHAFELRLPAEGYAIKAMVLVGEGAESVIEARPVYRYAKRPDHSESFLKGLSRFELFLDGRRLATTP